MCFFVEYKSSFHIFPKISLNPFPTYGRIIFLKFETNWIHVGNDVTKLPNIKSKTSGGEPRIWSLRVFCLLDQEYPVGRRGQGMDPPWCLEVTQLPGQPSSRYSRCLILQDKSINQLVPDFISFINQLSTPAI